MLLKQIQLRFGPPDAATRTRVEAAKLEALERWTERILTATTLGELFDDEA